MATEAKNGNGWLHGVLVDGARRFPYRRSLYSLLGHAEPGSIEMKFSHTLPAARFPGAVLRPAGEFALPDQLFTAGSQTHSQLEELAIPEKGVRRHQTASTSQQAHGERDLSWKESGANLLPDPQAGETNQPQSKEPGERSPFAPLVVGKTTDMPALPGSKSHPAPKLAKRDAGRPTVARSSKTVLSKAVPDVHAISIPGGNARKIETKVKPVDGRAGLALVATGNDASCESRAEPKSTAARDRRHSLPDIPLKPFIPTRNHAESASTASVAHAQLRSEDLGPLMQSSLPARVRKQDRANSSHRAVETPQPSDETTTYSPAPAQQQVVVIKQNPDPVTPAAFWERRYLSHLCVRIRR